MSIPDGIICSIDSESISKKEHIFFKQTNPLGFILFSRNYNNKRQLTNLISELKNLTLNKSPFIFIDQEGGRVQRGLKIQILQNFLNKGFLVNFIKKIKKNLKNYHI